MFLFNGNDTLLNGLNVDMEKRNARAIVAAIPGVEMDELQSLGINVKGMNVLNDRQELRDLAYIIKQSMYEDFKLAYSRNGENHCEEATATVNI